MNKFITGTIIWLPRVLCILFAAFIGMFSLDVFSSEKSIGEMLIGFLIHNVPVYIILVGLALAWRRAWIGAIMFTLFGVLYFVSQWGRFPLSVYAIISGPCFLMAFLFALSWIVTKRIKDHGATS